MKEEREILNFSAILFIMGCVLLMSSYFGYWYVYRLGDIGAKFSFDGVKEILYEESDIYTEETQNTTFTSWSLLNMKYGFLHTDKPFPIYVVFSQTSVILSVAIIISILTIIAYISMIYLKKIYIRTLFLLGFSIFIVSFFAAIYFMIALPFAWNETREEYMNLPIYSSYINWVTGDPDIEEGPWYSFFGKCKYNEYGYYHWHPAWGWYTCILGGALFLIGVFKQKRDLEFKRKLTFENQGGRNEG